MLGLRHAVPPLSEMSRYDNGGLKTCSLAAAKVRSKAKWWVQFFDLGENIGVVFPNLYLKRAISVNQSKAYRI